MRALSIASIWPTRFLTGVLLDPKCALTTLFRIETRRKIETHLIMRIYVCAAGLWVLSVIHSQAHAASTLPIRDGEYATKCTGGVPDILASMGYYSGVLSPQAEGQSGYCHVRNLKVAGNAYSGSSNCDTGTSIRSSTGTYRFAYKILNESTFVSRGKTYHWCTLGR